MIGRCDIRNERIDVTIDMRARCDKRYRESIKNRHKRIDVTIDLREVDVTIGMRTDVTIDMRHIYDKRYDRIDESIDIRF